MDGQGLPLLPQPRPFLWGDLKLPLSLRGSGPCQPLLCLWSRQALPTLQDLEPDSPSLPSRPLHPPPPATSRIRREKRGPLLSPGPVGLGQV